MLSEEIIKLERENQSLRTTVRELEEKLESKPKSKECRFCKHYIQHYGRMNDVYFEIYAGHCVADVPVKKGRKKHPLPNDVCVYFELGK